MLEYVREHMQSLLPVVAGDLYTLPAQPSPQPLHVLKEFLFDNKQQCHQLMQEAGSPGF